MSLRRKQGKSVRGTMRAGDLEMRIETVHGTCCYEICHYEGGQSAYPIRGFVRCINTVSFLTTAQRLLLHHAPQSYVSEKEC